MDQHQSGVVGFHEVDEERSPRGSETEGSATEVVRSGLMLNPFIGILWLAVAVMLVGGVTFLLNAPFSVSMADRVSTAYVLFSLAPQGVFVGLLTFLGLMFWHARQWQRRHG